MGDAHLPRLIRRALLPDGLELPYLEQGGSSGTPVVFLHAYADSLRPFERLLPHLPRSIRAVAVTQRGHGDAGRPTTGYRVEDFAGDLADFMDVLELEHAVLVASSSASFTAQRFAIANPLRALGLVLIGVPWSLRDKRVGSSLVEAVSELRDPVDTEFVRDFVESAVAGPVPQAFLETMIGESLKMPAHVWKATMEGLLEATPANETDAISAPTLIVWGDRDDFVPRSDQERLAARIPGSRLLVYRGAGHVVHWEAPERVAADITRFVGGLDS